ncbi:N-acetylmuramoyl-L-alanine amidase [Paraclostridium bifermentans]
MNKLIKSFVKFGLGFVITVVFVAQGKSLCVNANENAEQEFNDFFKKYNENSIIVEEGISIRKGEKLNLSNYKNIEVSNENIVQLDETGNATAITEGTVFLSGELNNKVHIIEVYVPSDRNQSYRHKRSIENSNRDYYKVFIDPGHGGNDSGSVGNGNYEDELNLEIAKKVEKKLNNDGIDVLMSRNSDEFITLGDRSKMANEYKPDVFLSIHQNSADNTSANGIETYYHSNKEIYIPYAQDVQYSAINKTNSNNRGVKSANFAVLRETNMPAVLFESGFISNSIESGNLANSEYQDKLASGIYEGIKKYLQDNIILDGKLSNIINTGIVTSETLNVRSGCGTQYSIVGQLLKGDKVDIVEKLDGWYRIKYNGIYGYISSKYIELDDKESNITSGWKQIEGKWYYYHNGETLKNWQEINKVWYYFKSTGEMQTGWLKIGEKWYYLKTSGAMAIGWEQVGNTWYYFKSTGEMQTGWLKIGEKWYYLKTSGAMAIGWEQVGNTWYYFKSTGEMQTGWLKIGGKWYYLKTSGAMAIGWEQVGNTWYYFKSTGEMQTGWLKIGGKWYYLKSSGAMAIGWEQVGNTWYYFYKSGIMATNTVIDGYKINKDGISKKV